MSMFSPLANRGRGTTSLSIPADLFHHSWKAGGTSADGSRSALSEFNLLPPTHGKAFFHFLLDASGSTWDRCSTGERKRVYESLLDSFTDLILHNQDVLRPHDQIVVWVFNKRTKRLCSVPQKDFHTKINFIRESYSRELNHKNNTSETRLYDAVGAAMKDIRKTWKANKRADFFLVPFTDGQENTSKMSLEEMVEKITELTARLHTVFITANLPQNCALCKMLQANQSEVSLVLLENAEPREIHRGFKTLRDMIKAILVVVTSERGSMQMVRIADYAKSKEEMGEKIMGTLAKRMEESSLLGAWNSLRSISWK